MRKLMFMINGLYGGGAEKSLQTLLANLDFSRYEVTVYSMHPEDIDPEVFDSRIRFRAVFPEYTGTNRIAAAICGFLHKVRGKLFQLLPSGLFCRLFIRGDYDVAAAYIEGESTKILSGANRNSRKLAWVHIDLQANPWTAFLYHGDGDERAHYMKFDRVVCVSEAVRQSFIKKYSFPPERVIVRYNPIDTERIRALAAEEDPLPPRTRLRMITVGRLTEQKGYDRLLRIVKQLRGEGYDFELYILGEGGERPRLQAYIGENSLRDTVTLTGYQDNPYRWMSRADVYVSSSRAEGLALTVQEAFVLGLPAVCTDCSGVQEVFGGIECGIVARNDEEALAAALRAVLQQPGCLARYAKNAERRGAEFSLQALTDDITALFD